MSGGGFVPTRSLRRPLFAVSVALGVMWALILGPLAAAMGWLS